MTSKELWERLDAFPKLKARVEKILEVVENSTGEIELGDDAEEMLFREGQQLNQEALEGWAQTQATLKSEQFSKRHPSARKEIKKKSCGTPVLET